MALARKRIGWQFQSPRTDYYHKLVISHTQRHTEAWVEHSNGEKVLSASTKEWAIRSQLYNCTDVAASVSVGQVLAQRCLKSGITCLFFDNADLIETSEKFRSALQAFKDAHISLEEPDVIIPDSKPGINYDGYNRYAESKEWKEDYQHI
uniref:Large ribosomal subunit protein uL18m n=1 Tax=Arion vulgaris TaxID=1028688 RepID=A0A0B6ZVL3_9EUPU